MMNKDNQLIFEAYANKQQRVCENAQPICKTAADGSKFWYINDKRHREDGPAIERARGDKCWYINGKLHREDGPAVEHANGNKWWYINDKEYADAQQWAKAVLQMQKKPAEPNDVQEFLRTILSKQTKDLI